MYAILWAATKCEKNNNNNFQFLHNDKSQTTFLLSGPNISNYFGPELFTQ